MHYLINDHEDSLGREVACFVGKGCTYEVYVLMCMDYGSLH